MYVKIWWEDLAPDKQSKIMEDIFADIEAQLMEEMRDDNYEIPESLLGDTPAQINDYIRKHHECRPDVYMQERVQERINTWEGAVGEI